MTLEVSIPYFCIVGGLFGSIIHTFIFNTVCVYTSLSWENVFEESQEKYGVTGGSKPGAKSGSNGVPAFSGTSPTSGKTPHRCLCRLARRLLSVTEGFVFIVCSHFYIMFFRNKVGLMKSIANGFSRWNTQPKKQSKNTGNPANSDMFAKEGEGHR